jgi:hypothetical protein
MVDARLERVAIAPADALGREEHPVSVSNMTSEVVIIGEMVDGDARPCFAFSSFAPCINRWVEDNCEVIRRALPAFQAFRVGSI